MSAINPDKPIPTADDDRVPAGLATMSIIRWTLVIVMGLVAVLSVAYATGALSKLSSGAHAEHGTLYYCPMHPSVVQDHPGECPICSMTLVPKPEGSAAKKAKPAPTMTAQPAASGKYYCPMHPNRTSDDPNAKCPDCGMKMEPKPSAAAMQPATEAAPVPGLADIDLTPDRIQLIGMRKAKVERAALGDSLRTVAVVAANERGLAQISVRFSGWIQNLKVSETGQRVRRGEVLATVYSPDVLRAEQEYITAMGWDSRAVAGGNGGGMAHHTDAPGAALQGSLAADARRRLELLGIASPEIDAMAARGKAADSVPIRSPTEGFITARNVVPGAAIQPGAPLFEVADLSRVWLLADIFEQDAARLKIGQKATLGLAAYPGETFTGKVQFIYPTLNASTHTLRVRLEFPNKSGPGGAKLRPGMYGNVSLELPSASGLVIPSEGLVDTGEHQYVFVATGAGHFEPRLVRVGPRTGDKVQIIEGVAEGETVVTTGNFLVDSESRLRAAIEGQTTTAAATGGGQGPDCAADFDGAKFPDKARACRACEIQHRGMGTMEQDCKATIAKPWR